MRAILFLLFQSVKSVKSVVKNLKSIVQRLIRTHQVQQGTADGECEEIVYNIEHYELAHLSPDFCFISRADVQEQRIEHFPGVITSQDALEATFDRGKRNVRNIGVFQRRVEGEPEKNPYFLG